MKKKLYIVLGIAAVVLLIFVYRIPIFTKQSISPVVTVPAAPSVSVIFENGLTIATISGVSAGNAYQALEEAAKKQNLTLTTKQYDFGVFVEAIGAVSNTKEKSWIYFVNGKAGMVASDKYQVQQDDVVEWKYTTPLY